MAYFAFVALITAVLLELVVRYVLDVHPLTKENIVWEYNPTLGWRQEPGATGQFVKLDCRQSIKINSHGLREREIAYQKSDGVFRILVLGDSLTVGFEVPQEEVFSRVIEDELTVLGYKVQVVNAGCRGWGTDQSLLFLQREGLKYDPDVVLYCFCGNDLRNNTEIHRPGRAYGKAYFELSSEGELILRNVPIPAYASDDKVFLDDSGRLVHQKLTAAQSKRIFIRDTLVCRSSACTLILHSLTAVPGFVEAVSKGGSYRDSQEIGIHTYSLTLALVRKMKAISEEAGARFALCRPGFRDRTGSSFSKLLKDLGEQNWELGRKAGDRLPQDISPRMKYDAHFSEAGHQALGEAIAAELRAHGLVPQIEQAMRKVSEEQR